MSKKQGKSIIKEDLTTIDGAYQFLKKQGDYKNVTGFENRVKDAIGTLKSYAGRGRNPLAQFYLGTCYQNGWGVEPSQQEASKYFQSAGKQLLSIRVLSKELADMLENEILALAYYEHLIITRSETQQAAEAKLQFYQEATKTKYSQEENKKGIMEPYAKSAKPKALTPKERISIAIDKTLALIETKLNNSDYHGRLTQDNDHKPEDLTM